MGVSDHLAVRATKGDGVVVRAPLSRLVAPVASWAFGLCALAGAAAHAQERPPIDAPSVDAPSVAAPPTDPANDDARASVDALPFARLVYVPGRFAARCPSEVEVHEAVARRLGRTPFGEPAARVVVLQLDGDGDEPARAAIELFDDRMTSLGARSIDSTEGCAELVAAAALAVSIALAPTLPPPLEAAPAPPAPVPPPVVAADEPAAAPPASPPRQRPPHLTWLPDGAVFVVGIGGHGSANLGPQPAVGPHVSAHARLGPWSLGLEQRQHVPRIDDALGVLHGGGIWSAVGCGNAPLVALRGDGDALGPYACATVSAGSLWAIGAYVGGAPFVGAGGRVGVAWWQTDLSAFRAWAQLEYSVVRPTFYALNGPPPFTQTAPVAVAAGVTLELSWPRP